MKTEYGEAQSPEAFGYFQIPVNEQHFSVKVYDTADAPEYSNYPKIALDNINTYIENDSLNISFDFKVEKGALPTGYTSEKEGSMCVTSTPIYFYIQKKWSFMEDFPGLGSLLLGSPLLSSFSSFEPTKKILFEGDSLHFHFKVDDFFKEYHWQLDVPYILYVDWNDPLIPVATRRHEPIFTYEYILSSSNIENVIDDESFMPVEIFTLEGIKVAETIESLKPGIYITKQGHEVRKIIVR